ncbi:MAG: CDP-alcohol phosphatidyltransferase family protein [Deltaproteobacteria bacterium]|nr:CDP-alcohol phosphatidyltransferase family protein [Deltaproteobacteria bacterium]
MNRPQPAFARWLDPAHALSLSRVALAGLLWLRADDAAFLLVIVAIASFTDIIDGWVGRRLHDHRGPDVRGTQDIGAWLDPVCDKIFAASVVVAVVVVWDAPWMLLPLLLVRDALTLVLAIGFRLVDAAAFVRHDFRARPLGKLTTVLQMTAVVAVLVAPGAALPLATLAAIAGAAAVADRVIVALRPSAPAR